LHEKFTLPGDIMTQMILQQSSKEVYTNNSGLVLVGQCIQCSGLSHLLTPHVTKEQKRISLKDILVSYVGLLCVGSSTYHAISEISDALFFKSALDLQQIPSEETLRQRLDEVAKDSKTFPKVIAAILRASVRMLSHLGVNISGYGREMLELIPLDIDVTPLDNSNTKKEGVAYTYKNFFGYTLMAAYLGIEGWCLGAELRPGDQHAQKDFVKYLGGVLERARLLTSKPFLVRLDSAHDASETLFALSKEPNVHFIIKWNPRRSDREYWLNCARKRGKEEKSHNNGIRSWILETQDKRFVGDESVSCRRIVRVTEETVGKNGQQLLIPTVYLEGWLTDLDFSAQKIIDLYRQHATSEQFHSEIKNDMGVERLPSGNFKTNTLVMALSALAYNILRVSSQMWIESNFTKTRHPVIRRRIGTVIQNLINVSCRFIRSGRQIKLRFGHNYSIFKEFYYIYDRLCIGKCPIHVYC
jgi:hypothetical protein